MSLFDRVTVRRVDLGEMDDGGYGPRKTYSYDYDQYGVHKTTHYGEPEVSPSKFPPSKPSKPKPKRKPKKKGSLRQLKTKVWMRPPNGDYELVAAFKAKGDGHLFADSKKSSPLVRGGGKFVVEDKDEASELTESFYKRTSGFQVDDIDVSFGPYNIGTPDHFGLVFKQGMSEHSVTLMPIQLKPMADGLRKLARHIEKAKLPRK